MIRSAGQPCVRLFSRLVLFFVITVQVAAVRNRSTKWPHPVLQLESEREPGDDGEAHSAFTKWMITQPGRCQVPLLLLLPLPPEKSSCLVQQPFLLEILFIYHWIALPITLCWQSLPGLCLQAHFWEWMKCYIYVPHRAVGVTALQYIITASQLFVCLFVCFVTKWQV